MKSNTKQYNDTLTITMRCLLLSKRNSDTFFTSIILPILMMILFISLFGNLIHIEGMSYVNFIVPGIIIQCIAQGSGSTAVMMNKDLNNGMVTRYSTLPIKKASILTGHVMEALVRSLVTSFVTIVAAMFLGFRPSLNVMDFGVVLILLIGVTLILSWLAIIIGIVSKSAEGATGLSAIAILLPYLSSGFVPVDSLPNVLKLFAEYQPMTPIIDTLRNAFLGNALDTSTLLIALLWCISLVIVFYILSVILFKKHLSK